ncbi:MAG: hypothetical protein ACLTFZ_02060 [Lachnospiraceae bacterium]
MKRKFWIVLMMAVSVLAGCGNVEGTMAEERASGEQQSVVDEDTEVWQLRKRVVRGWKRKEKRMFTGLCWMKVVRD